MPLPDSIEGLPAAPPIGSTPSPSSYTTLTMALREVRDLHQHLAGRLKTLADAMFSDPVQRKAMKDLIHELVWTEHYTPVREWADRVVLKPDVSYMPTFPFSYPAAPPPSE